MSNDIVVILCKNMNWSADEALVKNILPILILLLSVEGSVPWIGTLKIAQILKRRFPKKILKGSFLQCSYLRLNVCQRSEDDIEEEKHYDRRRN